MLKLFVYFLVFSANVIIVNAQTLETSLYPKPRPHLTEAHRFANLNIDGQMGYSIIDLETGQSIFEYLPNTSFSPASVTKTITAIFALDKLGPTFQFETKVLASHPPQNGHINGDLFLIGDGDPELETKDLLDIIQNLKAKGISHIQGNLYYHENKLPVEYQIDSSQPIYVGYNPSISGLNLNYNRAYFEWKKTGDTYDISLDARWENIRPKIDFMNLQVVQTSKDIFTYTHTKNTAKWHVDRAALGNHGGRWLPIRHSGLYAATVFRELLKHQNISFSGKVLPISQIPTNTVHLSTHKSAQLNELVQQMLKYSTNLTAEALGMRASQTIEPNLKSLKKSSQIMTHWARRTLKMRTSHFVDHSGLNNTNRSTPREMANALIYSQLHFPGFFKTLKPITAKLSNSDESFKINAKTGTLNFVSGLAGIIIADQKPKFAFSIFIQDQVKRAKIPAHQRANATGAKAWNTRTRQFQYDLINRFLGYY